MPKEWEKYIARHPDREGILEIIRAIHENELSLYEVKKLIGYDRWYRVRK